MKKITSLLALLLVFAWNVNAQITSYPYVEDFESGDGGWVVAGTGSWELGAPANTIINSADSGANAWVTNLTGNYNTNEDVSVESPVFDFSSLSAPSIEFSIWWNAENSWDGMVLQSSIDSGASWQNVGDLGDPNNWYNDGTIGGNPGGQQIGWTGRELTGNGSNGWVTARHALVGLAGESNVILRVAFGSDGSVQDEGVGFDTVNIFEVSCPEPTGILVSNVLDVSADVEWAAGGAETNWEVVVQPAGSGPPSGPGVSTGTIPYTVTGLTAITDYEVYVRSDCGGDSSSWVGPVTFQTACAVFIPDYNADMSVNVDDCWEEAGEGEVADGPGGLGASDWRDGTNYAFGDSNAINIFAGNSDREWLLSPLFDLSADGYQLEVNVAVTNWLNGNEDDSMGSDDEVRLLQSNDGGASWITLTTWNAANEPAVGGTEYIEDLTGVTGTSVQFAIWASDGVVDDAEDYDFHVGKFRVRTPPSCLEPLNLTLDTFSDTTAVVSWTPGGSEVSWEVVVQPAGTGEPTGPGTSTTDNPYTITGLTATTAYEVWVRGDCGPQGLSSWTGPLTFTTLNTPPPPPVGVTCASGSSSFIFTGEFDGVDGWTGNINEGDGSWEIPGDAGSADTGPDAAFSGANYMNYEASGNADTTASAVTPAIDLTTAEDGAELSFYMHAFGDAMGTLTVGVSTSSTGPFAQEFIWAGDLQTSETDPWVPIGINLDAYLGQVIYIEFSHTGTGTDFTGDMSIDLVRVETCGSFCIAPSSIVTSNATQTTVDIDWTANSGESAWEYVVVPLGTGEPTGPGTPTATTSVNVTGLMGSTEYEVWVRADCGGGVFSLWAGPIPFFTAPENNDPCSAITAVVNTDDTCDLTTFGTIFQATSSGVPAGSCTGDPDDDVWFQFVAENEVQLISLTNIAGGTFNLDHALYEGDCNSLVELDCSDGDASVSPALIVGNTYYIRVFSGGSDPETSTFDLCIRDAPTNIICENAENFCEDGGALTTPNIIGIPDNNDIACLGTAPNPTWNIIQIGDPGLIEIEIVQTDDNGDGLDVDFVLWGPFVSIEDACMNIAFEDCPTCPNNTGDPDFYPFGNIVDCSYSIQSTENMTIDNAMTGEIYMLLVTNFSDDPGTISISQTNGGNPDDGNVTAEIEVDLGTDQQLCGFPSYELIADSPFADRYEWYCNGFIIPGEESGTLTVTDSCTYTVIAFDDECQSQAMDEVTITFGAEPVANAVADIVTCDDASADGIEDFDLEIRTDDVLGAQNPADFNVTYHLTLAEAQQGINPLSSPYTNVTNPQTIFIRVEDANATFCFATTSFQLDVSGPTPTATSDTYPECDDNQDGIAAFDLPSRDANVLDGQSAADFTVTYYTTLADAELGTNPIDTSMLYNSPATTIFVRVESNLAFDCYATTTMDLVVNTSPDASFTLSPMILCDIGADGVEDFNLESLTATIIGSQNPADFNVTYHTSQSDADMGIGDLTSPYSSSGETIYIRVENDMAPECFITDSFVLTISGVLPTATSDLYPECDDDFDGIADFNLTSRDANILGGQNPADFTVSYYESQADADAGTNAINTSSLYSSPSATIYVRVQSNVASNCYATTTLELLVDPLPDTSFSANFDYEVCPGATTPIQVTATANNYNESEVSINWYFEGGLIAGENSLSIPVIDAGLYEIEVTFNLTGCTDTVSQMVIELPNCVIPQGISPNGDGKNDTFDLSSYDVTKLEIFNRNGISVYSKTNYTNEWYGQTDDGDELPVGTYFYTMEYDNGKRRTAWVYIQRLN